MAAPIAHVEVSSYAVPMHVPFAISRETLPMAEGALVALVDADGRTGLGECAPFPSLTGDDVLTATARARDLVGALPGKTPEAALAWLETVRADVFAVSRTAYVGVEGALWDLLARQRGVPLADLWGSARLASVTTDITLPIMPAAAVPGFWGLFADHGFPTVKVKVSGHVATDLAMIHALRAVLPPAVTLTLDGNQAFAVDSARALVASLGEQGIHPLFFEQPLPEDDFAGLARLSALLPIPVCVDETVKTAADAARVVRDRLAGIVNLKIMKSSIAEARAIIATTLAGGLRLMIGGMLEGEIAMGLSLHLACGTGAVSFVDLDTPFFFTRLLTRDSPWHRRSAVLTCPRTPGHGMEKATQR